MKRIVFALMFLVCLSVATTASAQSEPTYDNDNTGDPCPTYDSCSIIASARWWNQPGAFGSNPDRPCPGKGSTCQSCFDSCECEYKKNENKCNNGVTCLNLARAEKSACDATCIEHYC